MNPKNQLQEYCQKRGLVLPKYHTKRVGGEPHNPEFQSEVTLNEIYISGDITRSDSGVNDNHIIVPGDTCGSKKQAELSAATFVLDMLEHIKTQNTKHYQTGENIYIYIDIENVHIGDFLEHHKFHGNFYMTGVATANHPAIKKISQGIKLRTINSDHKDAADTLMIYDIGLCIERGYSGTYIIVTKDHFAASLCEIINSDLGHLSKAYRCKSMEQLEEILERFIKK